MASENRIPWSKQEDEQIMQQGKNLGDLATKLGRTVHAIYQRRAVLRKSQSSPGVKQYFTQTEDDLILRSTEKVSALAKRLGRSPGAIYQRRTRLRNRGVLLVADDKTPVEFQYSDPLDKLFEPEVPTVAYSRFENWWHYHSPPCTFDREQVQMAFLHGYALARRGTG